MNRDVLVLNKNFYAIQITSWQKALSLLYINHASVVDTAYMTYSFEDWRKLSSELKEYPAGFINTPNFKIAIPEVISLKIYDKLPSNEVKFTRRNIYEHYNYKCCYCGKKLTYFELNLEHVIPKSRGGKTCWENIVTSCIPCNSKKGNKLPSEANMPMLIKPSKPKWKGIISFFAFTNIKFKPSWKHFINTYPQ